MSDAALNLILDHQAVEFPLCSVPSLFGEEAKQAVMASKRSSTHLLDQPVEGAVSIPRQSVPSPFQENHEREANLSVTFQKPVESPFATLPDPGNVLTYLAVLEISSVWTNTFLRTWHLQKIINLGNDSL